QPFHAATLRQPALIQNRKMVTGLLPALTSPPRSPWLALFSMDQIDLVRGVRLRIFLLSFTLLFFELLCIRWIPAYVRYLSYFTNFILLASFIGIGLGVLGVRLSVVAI